MAKVFDEAWQGLKGSGSNKPYNDPFSGEKCNR